MNFKDIKIGDSVLVYRSVSFVWSGDRVSWVPEKVIHVTKTQFVLKTKSRYRKSDGGCIGVGNAIRVHDKKKEEGDAEKMRDDEKTSDFLYSIDEMIRKINTSLTWQNKVDIKKIERAYRLIYDAKILLDSKKKEEK